MCTCLKDDGSQTITVYLDIQERLVLPVYQNVSRYRITDREFFVDTPTTTTTTTTTTISPTTKATTPKTTTTSPTTTTSQQTTTTSLQTTTTSLQTTAPYNTSTLCSCTCTDNSYLTSDDLNVKISNIVQNLTVTKRSTSTFLRTKNCAQDSRPEVVYVGYVGIGLLVFVASLIALPDLLSLYLFMYSLWEKGKSD